MAGLERGASGTGVLMSGKSHYVGDCCNCVEGCTAYALVFMYQYGACTRMHVSGYPFGLMRQVGLCWSGGSRHSGRNSGLSA